MYELSHDEFFDQILDIMDYYLHGGKIKVNVNEDNEIAWCFKINQTNM